MRDRVTVWLAVFGVLAVVLGGVLAFTDLWPGGDAPSTAKQTVPPRTHRFVSTSGGFAVRVPDGMTSTRQGDSVRFGTRDHRVVMTVGPVAGSSVTAVTARLVQQVRTSYAGVKVLGHRRDRVAGRAARTTYGTARNARLPLRFVLLVVPGKPRPFAISAFTAAGSDPRTVLPLVDQVAGSFRVLAAK